MSGDLGHGKLTRYCVATVALAASAIGCAESVKLSPRDLSDANDTGRTLAAKDDADRALLLQLPGLPNGTPRKFGSKTVVAEAAYSAASGRSCRALQLSDGSHSPAPRLACSDGKAWFFVPDVFGVSDAPE